MITTDNSENTLSPEVRAKYASISGWVGILLNVFLFAIKFATGILSGYVSIVADAFNNITDAASSVIMIIGFKIAGNSADAEHPYGHGRSEYISGLIVSMLILLVGYELLKSSIIKILRPQREVFSLYLVFVLIVSVFVKLIMYAYNTAIAKKLNSSAIAAVAKDSINDVFTTSAVLLSLMVGNFFNINIDGYCGILVGLLIIKGGYDTFKDTSGDLLGHGVDSDFTKTVEKIVLSYDDILGIHDLMVHDYGPGRRIISLHAEVDAKGNILDTHDSIDNIERELGVRLNASATIHMDPIITDDEEVASHRKMVEEIVHRLERDITIHDFRMVKGPTHTNLIFDIVLPYDSPLSEIEALEKLSAMIHEADNNHYAVITVDRPMG